MTDSSERESAVSALASLPLYQLSTAGMELFHTNMLYWLAMQRPVESAPLWEKLGLFNFWTLHQVPFIRREWQHLDLVVSTGTGSEALVLENKIGAIPTPVQLCKYHASLDGNEFFPETATSWVLLTLTPPTFDLPGPWKSITYDELIPSLKETRDRLSGDDQAFISSYSQLVTILDDVTRQYDPLNAPHNLALLSASERLMLREARLLSLIEKVRMVRFAEFVMRALIDSCGEFGEIYPDVTHGVGLVSWFITGSKGRSFGWQIQGHQFRLYVRTGTSDPKMRIRREALVAEHFASFFNFSVPDRLKNLLTPYRGRKKWLGFEPNMEYQYAELSPNATWTNLVDLAVWFSCHTREFVKPLE